jgi:tetratricopeptide (TPR) repeat protein
VDLELTIVLGLGVAVIAGLVALLVKQRLARKPAATPRSRRAGSSLRTTKPPRTSDGAPKSAPRKLSDHEVLASEGKLQEAGRIAMRAREWNAAMGYYLDAGELANAAHCARHAELFERAAELYEKAGDMDAAADCHDRLGNAERARELRRQGTRSRQHSQPEQQAEKAEGESDMEAQVAAAISAGDRQRAAELLEQAGERERAATEWVEVARRAADPSRYIERIARLSATACHRFLELETRARPLSQKSVELHYQLAISFARMEADDTARGILKKILDTVGDYKASSVLLTDPSQAAKTRTLPSHRAHSDRPMELLTDTRVVQARSGPSIAELSGMLNGQPCDLGNIEVFYRLGLAYLADEKFEEALRAFGQVSEVSPGYRDADRRVEHIRTKLSGKFD